MSREAGSQAGTPPEAPSLGAPDDVLIVLEAEEHRFRKLAESSWDTIALIGLDTAIKWISPSISRVLGYEPDVVLGRLAFDFVHPEDLPLAAAELERTLNEAGGREAVVLRVHHADGSWRHMGLSGADLSADPDVQGIVLNLRDVTAQVEAERALQDGERRFRSLAAASPTGIFEQDPLGRITYVNDRFAEITGLPAAAAHGYGFWNVVAPDDFDLLRAAWPETLRRNRRMGLRIIQPDGSERWVVTRTAPLFDDSGGAVGVVGSLDDVTDLNEAQHSTRRLTELLENTSDLVAVASRSLELTYMNRAARRFFALEDVADLRDFQLLQWVPVWVRDLWDREIMPTLLAAGHWSGELAITSAEGSHLPVSTVVMTHLADDGQIESISAVSRDISERKAFEARLEHEATHDPLTGLPNRTLLMDRIEVASGRAERSGHLLGMLFLDLDHFKVVNDSLGHGLGDRLLVALAERLSHTVRPGDTVARFGGDEFVILCEDLSSEAEAHLIAERVLVEVRTPLQLGDAEVFVTASVGIAYASAKCRSPEDLLRDADAAMYQAKSRGRARAEVFDITMHVQAVDRMDLENALRRALERHELRLHYQPKIALDTGRIVGAEALLRWAHPERGILAPRDFLRIAEDTGLIVPIGSWVLSHACRAMGRIQAELPDQPPLYVCVNLSARQLAHPSLSEDLQRIIDDTGIDPGLIDLEITENVLMDDVEVTQRALRRLKSLGVQLAVDDFGTGYSSLSYLRRFPVDLLKVDQAFVDGLGRDPEDSAIVAAIVNLAHTLGLEAIAEGVETAEQLAELRVLGCDMAQGFYMSRPVPDTDLVDLLRSNPVW